MDDYIQKLLSLMPTDHSGQVDTWYYSTRIKDLLSKLPEQKRILDLGAGSGSARSRIMASFEADEAVYTGVDISDSPEVGMRAEGAPDIHFYDGRTLPFGDQSFHAIWSRQVLEHVRYPDDVLAEVERCLTPNGYFLGSVSQLEPYHSRSIFNWTHYGIVEVFGSHNLDVIELRPGVDGILMIIRSLFGRKSPINNFFNTESPINHLLQHFHSNTGSREQSVRLANYRKLTAAGHIHFLAKKMN